jgi:hypothetical protein
MAFHRTVGVASVTIIHRLASSSNPSSDPLGQ